MMDGTFIEQLDVKLARPTKIEVDGQERLLVNGTWRDVTPGRPQVDPLDVNTLTGLIDYLKSNMDNLDRTLLMIHVVSPSLVQIVNRIEDEEQRFRRRVYLTASTAMVDIAPFPFANFLPAEDFLIRLQTQFERVHDWATVAQLVASIRESDVRETVDNGVSQEVTTAGGVVLVGVTKVPNPVQLAPYRTFREVDQPSSLFLLRLKKSKDGDKPLCALFESDGGRWRLEAIQNIKGFLEATSLGVAILA